MRKHNEGYALVLVLVVLIVLALLSTIILTGAQRNLDAQVTSVEYMKAKYQAQGEIEKIVGKLEALGAGQVADVQFAGEDPAVEIDAENKTVTVTACCDNVQIVCVFDLYCTSVMGDGNDNYTLNGYGGFSCASYEISTKEVTTNDEPTE